MIIMRDIGNGQIYNLLIRNGNPVFDPHPKITRQVKFGSTGKLISKSKVRDYFLKKQVIEFLAELDQIGEGRIKCIEVQDGLPFKMRVEAKIDK